MAKKSEYVLVLCAHSDDQIFGAGGTLAKYAEEGKKVIIVVFSYGEKSHPWLKKRVSVKIRVKESHEAAKIIKADETIFLGLEETKFPAEIENKNIGSRIRRLMEKYRPAKIFTHSPDDPLPDHSDLSGFVIGLCEKMNYAGELYSFDVWNPVKIRQRDLPKLYVDITGTFKTKLEALKCFESQKMAMISLLWSVYVRAIINGFKSKHRFAERFHKIR